jgi:hypothetical protein
MGIIISRSSAKTTRTATQPRWDMDASIIEAAVLSISTDNDTFRLLDLPPELVARTTSFVNSEGVIATRLACKALEAITFERFAIENFEHMYCWIRTNQDFDRLKDILGLSPRLSSKIRQLTLTADVLRGRPIGTLQHVRMSYMDDKTSKYWTMAE